MMITAEDRFIPAAVKEIKQQRILLENYIRKNPVFKTCLTPCRVRSDAPEIVRRMAEAGETAGVGPMAAVAGAIAEYAVRALVKAGARFAVADNGGDIAMVIDKPVTLGVYAGEAKIPGLRLRIEPKERILGICTSSGTLGHSLSLGSAHAATVFSEDVFLADAAATALGNHLDHKDKNSVKAALEQFMFQKINGIIAVVDDIMGICGDVPRIVGMETSRRSTEIG